MNAARRVERVTDGTYNAEVSESAPWTVGRIIEWTTGYLERHGSETARLDTEILLAHVRGCQRIELYTRFDEVVDENQRTRMRELVRRRAAAEPVAYLVGHREFFGLDMRVTRDVLIPRPDTETLVMEALEAAKSYPQPRILDLGTGTGCIAVAIAVNCPEAQLTAIDISPAALDVARQNAGDHRVHERIRLLEGDLFAPLGDEQFDLILSNPPYIPNAELDTLQDDVRKFEPRLALAGGEQGLDVVARIVDGASRHLAAGGWVMIEIDSPQQGDVEQRFRSAGGYANIGTVKDLAGKARVVRAQKSS